MSLPSMEQTHNQKKTLRMPQIPYISMYFFSQCLNCIFLEALERKREPEDAVTECGWDIALCSTLGAEFLTSIK